MKNLAKKIGVGLAVLALPFAALAAGAKSKNVNLDVSGMTCSACETKVRDALAAIDGVEVKQVDYKAGKVHCMIDPEKVSTETVVSAVKSAGFDAKEHGGKTEG